MKRVAMLAALAVGMAGCGGDDPAVTQVTVTVRQGGVVMSGVDVVESAAVDSQQLPPSPTGVMGTATTNSSGQATFTVPASTTSGALCFSSLLSSSGGFSFVDDCKTLNALTSTVALDHL